MKPKVIPIKRLLILFMAGLFISGLTAIPIDAQLRFLMDNPALKAPYYSKTRSLTTK